MALPAPFVSDREATKPTSDPVNGESREATHSNALEATGSTSLGLRRELIAGGLALIGAVAGVGLMAGATVLGLWVQRHAAPAREQPLSILAAAPGPTDPWKTRRTTLATKPLTISIIAARL